MPVVKITELLVEITAGTPEQAGRVRNKQQCFDPTFFMLFFSSSF